MFQKLNKNLCFILCNCICFEKCAIYLLLVEKAKCETYSLHTVTPHHRLLSANANNVVLIVSAEHKLCRAVKHETMYVIIHFIHRRL
jgi:hypothetical protein